MKGQQCEETCIHLQRNENNYFITIRYLLGEIFSLCCAKVPITSLKFKNRAIQFSIDRIAKLL